MGGSRRARTRRSGRFKEHDPLARMGETGRAAGLVACSMTPRNMEAGIVPCGRSVPDRRGRWCRRIRIEVDGLGPGAGGRNKLAVDHIVIEGGPGPSGGAWSESEQSFWDRTWIHKTGSRPTAAGQARHRTTGYEAPAVYGWSRRQGVARSHSVKCVEGFTFSSGFFSGPDLCPM